MKTTPSTASVSRGTLLTTLALAGLTACASQPAPLQLAADNSPAAQANKQLIENFYKAFQQRDAETMAASYNVDAHFSDPAFTDLNGDEVGDMWRMLTSKAQNFSLRYDGVKADAYNGEAHWVATYTFSQTGRTVVNDIHATFTFKNGRIQTHTDSWDLWRWSSQALGLKGQLLGWSPLVSHAIHKKASEGLAQYRKENGR